MTEGGVAIADTFAEAFPMTAARALVTAATPEWAGIAGRTMSGYATSVIGCDAEAAVERVLAPGETPDGRPGVSVLVFAFSRDALEKALANRVGQCVMTCPTTACYNGLPVGEKTINVGGRLRYFGDGWQIAKRLEGRRFWRIPVMDGEFTCEETFGTVKGVAGGNLILLGNDPAATLEAATAAAEAMRACPDVILPFPGGIARSGSKVGSKYKKLRASTNTAFAPTLRGLVEPALPGAVQCAYEIVIDGLSLEAVERATAAGLRAGCRPGIVQITAGNYGGKLGPFHIRLRDLLSRF
jgi:formylmethanofuran--tetrahydromethanopterin N-formyltransferase